MTNNKPQFWCDTEKNYQFLIHNLPFAVFRSTLGPEPKIVMANKTMLKLFAYNSITELQEISFKELYAIPYESRVFFEKLMYEGEIKHQRLLLKKKTGEHIWGIVSATVIWDTSGKVDYIEGFIEDITERKKIGRLFTAQKTLALKMLGVQEFSALLRAILRFILKATEFDVGAIYISEHNKQGLKMAYQEGLSECFADAIDYFDPDSQLMKIIARKKPQYLPFEQVPFENPAINKLVNLSSIAIAPVVRQGKVIGSVFIASRKNKFINDELRLVFETLVGQVGQAISQGQLMNELKTSEERLCLFMKESAEKVIFLDEHLKIVAVTKAISTKKQLLGQNISSLSSTLYEDLHEQYFNIIEKGCSFSCEAELTLNNEPLKYLLSAHRVGNEIGILIKEKLNIPEVPLAYRVVNSKES